MEVLMVFAANAIKPMVDNYALKLIIESLKNFPNDPEMISRGCKALRAIFSNSSMTPTNHHHNHDEV